MIKINDLLVNIIKSLIYLFPLTFIFGNLIINIFVFLIIIFGIIAFKKDLFIWNNFYLIVSVALFFLTILASTFYQVYFYKVNPDWAKSILYLRFFLLLLVVKTIIYKKILNLNYLIYSSFFITMIIALDILFQFLFGFNLLGNEPINVGTIYHSGFFNKELIAGGFILMFSIIGVFAIPLLLKNKRKFILFLFFLGVFSILVIALVLAGNRMPTIMFIFFATLLALIIKDKDYKKRFIFLSLIIFLIGSSIILTSEKYKRFKTFFAAIPNPVFILNEINKSYPKLDKYKNSGLIFSSIEEYKDSEEYKNMIPFYTGHVQVYITSLDLINDKPLFGTGIKSFRRNCSTKIHLPNRVCESHPHNFILDILNDVGFVGLFLIIIPVFILLIRLYKEYLKGEMRKNNISDWVYLAFILSTAIQLFPLKSSGSFFSTFNSSYTFLIIGVLFGLNEISYNKKA